MFNSEIRMFDVKSTHDLKVKINFMQFNLDPTLLTQNTADVCRLTLVLH